MIEQLPLPDGMVPSAFEPAFGAALEDLLTRRVWIIDFPPHAVCPGIDEAEYPELPAFRELLEAGAGHLETVRAAVAEESRQAAVKVRALAAFARCRPAELLDRPAEEVGAAAAASRAARPTALTEVSEWAVDEVAASLGLSSRTANELLAASVTLVEELPATVTALEAGTISWSHARMLADVLAPLTAETRAQVEVDLLARAAGRTVAQLKATAQRAVLRADATVAAARAARAVRERQVRLFAGEDGMAVLSAAFPAPLATACYSALEAYADACATPDDERTKAQRMVDCLGELILQPGVNPPVQVQLTVTASGGTLTGGQEPGEVDGHPVPAGMVRELAYALHLLPRPEPEPTEPEPAEPAEADQPMAPAAPAAPDIVVPPEADGRAATPRSDAAPERPPAPAGEQGAAAVGEESAGAFGRAGNEGAATDLAALLGLSPAARGVLAAPPTIAIIDELSGQLLALSDSTEIRRTATCHRRGCRTGRRPCTHPPSGCGLGPPGAGSEYAPADRLATFVRARDRRCRFPGCRARAVHCDLDHNIPWPQGPTSADNLCCLCRHHHRLSHQAPGWRLHRLPDGGLQWTLPGGQTLTTYPPRFGSDDEGSPLTPPAAPPPPTAEPPPPAEARPPTLHRR